jgi:hypothetical protein
MKDIAEIKLLMEQFFEGNTTLEEEKCLYDYFKQHQDLPEELEAYRELFLDLDAITLNEVQPTEFSEEEPTISLPSTELPANSTPPKHRRLWLKIASIAASIAIFLGSFGIYRTYENMKLQRIYGGSYMVVDGVRIDNLREILPQIKSALSLAEDIDSPSPTDLINQAEQDLLGNIQDAQERERIHQLLNQ